jgi:hypothetical protein
MSETINKSYAVSAEPAWPDPSQPDLNTHDTQLIRAGGGRSLFTGIRMVANPLASPGDPDDGRIYDATGNPITGGGGGGTDVNAWHKTGDAFGAGTVIVSNTNGPITVGDGSTVTTIRGSAINLNCPSIFATNLVAQTTTEVLYINPSFQITRGPAPVASPYNTFTISIAQNTAPLGLSASPVEQTIEIPYLAAVRRATVDGATWKSNVTNPNDGVELVVAGGVSQLYRVRVSIWFWNISSDPTDADKSVTLYIGKNLGSADDLSFGQPLGLQSSDHTITGEFLCQSIFASDVIYPRISWINYAQPAVIRVRSVTITAELVT